MSIYYYVCFLAALVVGLAGPVRADTSAKTLYDTDVYTAPGRYPVLGRLHHGDSVKIGDCLRDRSWCAIVAGKLAGWASGAALEMGKHKPPKAN